MGPDTLGYNLVNLISNATQARQKTLSDKVRFFGVTLFKIRIPLILDFLHPRIPRSQIACATLALGSLIRQDGPELERNKIEN